MIGAIIFLVIAIFTGLLPEIRFLDWYTIVVLLISVVTSVVIGDTLFFQSQNHVGVKIATPIINLYPIFSILIAILFLDEEFKWQFIFGSIITIVGIVVLTSGDNELEEDSADFERNYTKGIIYAFLSMLSYTLAIVSLTVGSEGLDPVVANTVRLPVGTILLFFLLLIQMKRTNKRKAINFDENRPKTRFIVFLLIAGILGTYLSSLFYVISTQKLGAGKSAVLTSVGPLFALPLSYFWLKENVTKFTVAGTLLTLIGLWIVLS
jgi:drug/metabolite transporter (DMT)-like permease